MKNNFPPLPQRKDTAWLLGKLELGIPYLQQRGIDLSLKKVVNLLKQSEDLMYYSGGAAVDAIEYAELPFINPLPYFMTTLPQYDGPRGFFRPQQFFHAVLVMCEDWSLEDAEVWRDILFAEMNSVVRLAYVSPTRDGVYLLLENYFEGGRYYEDFRKAVNREEEFVCSLIRRRLRNLQSQEYVVMPTMWCYIGGDPDARFRPNRIIRSEEMMMEVREAMKEWCRAYESKMQWREVPSGYEQL
jgi:hypothetical protein